MKIVGEIIKVVFRITGIFIDNANVYNIITYILTGNRSVFAHLFIPNEWNALVLMNKIM